jgi:hypothetical protein
VERIKPGFPTLLAEALDLIPAPLHERLACDVFTETDPVFAGLHHYRTTVFGASYGEVPHVTYPYHMDHLSKCHRRVTMFLPFVDLLPRCVVHEFGHVLHYSLGFMALPISPVTAYAQSDDRELFAEAFAAWVMPHEFPAHPGMDFVHFMESLGA